MYLKRAERRFQLSTRDYAQLAAFRHALRGFLRFSEAAAEAVGLTAQHYQAMLVLRACPEDEPLSINDLARQLLIKHNSAVGLVDRLEQEELMVRLPSSTDRRKVELHLTGRGRQLLSRLAAMHRRELERISPGLQRFFANVASIGLPQANGGAGKGARGPLKASRIAAKGATGGANPPRMARKPRRVTGKRPPTQRAASRGRSGRTVPPS